jgi:hypothetical protein
MKATYKTLEIDVPQDFLNTVLTYLVVQPSIKFYTTIFIDELDEKVDLDDEENESFILGILDDDGIKTIEECYAEKLSPDQTAEKFFNIHLQIKK